MVKTLTPVVLNMRVKMYDRKIKAARDYLRNPFTEDFVGKIRLEMKRQIEGTAANSMQRFHPYHTYPSEEQGELERFSFVEPIPGESVLVLGSRSLHASVLEDGKRATNDTLQIFHGYYPNAYILRRALRKLSNSRLSTIAGKMGFKKKNRRREVIEAIQNAYGKRAYGAHASRPFHTKQQIQATADPDAFARRFGIKPELDAYGYRFGIFTILTRKTRSVKPYRVFTQTAQWTEEEMVKEIGTKIAEIDRYV